jgi:hypothetical protein
MEDASARIVAHVGPTAYRRPTPAPVPDSGGIVARRRRPTQVSPAGSLKGETMSVEADFGLSDWVGQYAGTQLSWDISWPGVIDDARFVAVSFQSDFDSAQLVRVSEWFSHDGHVGELIRVADSLDPKAGVPFRFAVVVIPSN